MSRYGTLPDRLTVKKPFEKVARSAESSLTNREGVFAFWWAEIKRARNKLERRRKEDLWAEYRRIQSYEGDYADFNFITPPINDRIEEITGERADVMVEVMHAYQKEYVSQLEAMERHSASDVEYWPSVNEIVSDAAWLGIGWGKQDWNAGELPSTPGVRDMTAGQEREQMAAIEGEHLLMATYLQPINIQANDLHWLHLERHRQALYNAANLEERMALDQHIELHEAILPATGRSESKLIRIRPEDMIFDPDARDWRDTQWCAERTVEILEDVLANPDYKNASTDQDLWPRHEHRDAEASESEISDLAPIGAEPDESPGLRVVEVYRIYDKRGGPVWSDPEYRGPRLIILSPQQAKRLPLNVLPWPYRGNVYEPLVLIPAKERVEGVSMAHEIRYLHTQLKFCIEARVAAVRKAPKDRTILPKRLFSTEAERKAILDGSIDIAFTEKDFTQDQAVVIKPQPVNPDLFAVEGTLQSHINRTLRSAEVSQGVEGGAKFATEIEALLGARGRGVQDFQAILAAWLSRMRKKYFVQMHDFANTETVLSATGGVALDRNVLRPEEIPLDLEVRVDVDSLSAMNRELNKKQLREFLQFLFVESAGIVLPLLTPDGLTEIMVKALRLNGFKEPEKFVRTLDDATHSVMMQMLAGGQPVMGGPANTPGPNPAPTQPLQQPGMQTSGAVAADARGT